jgi:hypothetical protein
MVGEYNRWRGSHLGHNPLSGSAESDSSGQSTWVTASQRPDLAWPIYQPDGDHSGGTVAINPVRPPAPPRRPRRVLIAIVTSVVVAGVVVVGDSWLGVSRFDASVPQAAVVQWTKADPALTAGLVRVQITAANEADGIVMTKDGLVATSYSRIAGIGGSPKNITDIELRVTSDGGVPMKAEIIGFDAAKDVAVLRVPGFVPSSVAKPGAAVETGSALTLLDDQGESLPVMGHPVTVNATNQSCSRTGATLISRPSVFQFGLDVATAEPGGAVVADDGTVVGMYYGGEGDQHCAVPIADVAQVVNNVSLGKQTATTRVGPPGTLGVQLMDDDSTYPQVISIDNEGLLVSAVGVQVGDVLTRVGKTSLRRSELTTLGPDGVIRSLEPGQQVVIEWKSGGVTRTAKVKVGVGAEPNG